VTSAFITQAQPQLQPDPNEETAALLRVLIYKIDNTTFGNDVPTIPQWSGPPHTIVQVQAILYASLAASLFSAFLAMLGKQWLNRYASVDIRGSVIERSQNRQRKLDGIVTWHFDHVMESLPVMLQFALLLLGCALSLYLWEVDTTIALVVFGATSFGVASYAFFVVAGTASASCPYQTPGARILHYIPSLAMSSLRSASHHSYLIRAAVNCYWYIKNSRNLMVDVTLLLLPLLLSPITLSVFLVVDTYLLAQAITRLFVDNAPRVRSWFHRTRGWDPQTTTLDLQCISWMLQTPLDKTIHLSTLRLLATMTTLANFDPALVSACFNILTGCVSVVGGKVVVLQGSEELTVVSVLCCLRTLSHLRTVDPASSALKDVGQRYTNTFPIETNFEGLPSYYHFCIIHNLFYSSTKQVQDQRFRLRDVCRPRIEWKDYKLSSTEHVILLQVVRFKHRGERHRKVPRWILRFGHHILSQDPLPPAAVVIDCLSIIAIALGCTVSNTTILDERCVHIWQVPAFLTENQCAAGRGFEPDNR